MCELVAHYVIGCEASAIGHLGSVPERIGVGARFSRFAMTNRGYQSHASIVEAVSPVVRHVEVIRVAGVVVGFVYVCDCMCWAALGSHRAEARQTRGGVVVVVNGAIQGAVDMVEMQTDAAALRIDQHQLFDCGKIHRGYVYAPHKFLWAFASTQKPLVKDPQLRLSGLDLGFV